MKQVFRIAAASCLLLLGGVVSAQLVDGSPHDLAAVTGATTTETCVFCHTPHGSDIGAPVPLWNKTLPTTTTYVRYSNLSTSTLDGAETTVGSVSLACLSCHDGGQAMDSVLNAPGRGTGPAGASPTNLGTGVSMPIGGINNNLARIDTDLQDDHPISIQYAGGGVNATSHPAAASPTAFAGAMGDPDFNRPVRDTINGNPAWWVDSVVGTPLVREKTDMILYTRFDAGLDGGDDQPFVECGSCHDPHNAATGADPTVQVAFLRIGNDNSQICTTCHIK